MSEGAPQSSKKLRKAPEDREAADQRTANGPGEHLKPGQAPKECKRSREALKARPGIAQKSLTTLFSDALPLQLAGVGGYGYIYMENSMENPFFAQQFLRDNPQVFFHTAWGLGFDQQLPT